MRPALYTAEWVVPVTAPPVHRGGVLVDERGAIAAVAPGTELDIGSDVLHVALGDAILLPGLINTHTHPELAGMRGLLEDLPFEQWITLLRRARVGASLDSADFAAAARWTCLEALAGGVTTMAATEDSGAAMGAMQEAGLRGTVYREVFGPAPAQAAGVLEILHARVGAMRSRETDLVRVGISPHAPYTVSDVLFGLAARYAMTEGLPVAVHAAESAAEARLVTYGDGPLASGLRRRGIDTPPRSRSTIALLNETGVLATRPLLIHCVGADAADIELIRDSGAAVAHCPIANARLGHGVAAVPEMLEAGVTVGIGSDSVASNNRIDLLEEARVAQLVQRSRLASPSVMTAAELLRMLTIDGARALGLDSRVGSLDVGKDADLCAVRIEEPHTRPVHDPLATLIFSARSADVVLTAVRGRILYRDGVCRTLDAATVRPRLEDAAARLRAARDDAVSAHA
ncbi:MAG: amidohydrolase family protein [Gemmatimonadota bacterium]